MSNENIAPKETVDPETNRPLEPQLTQGEIIPQREKALSQIDQLLNHRRSMASLPLAKVPQELVDLVNYKPPVPTFPEPLFKQYFLPLFAGIAGADHPVTYETWIMKVAGSDRVPVDIVDEKGDVLFRVPALLDTSGLEQSTSGKSMTIIERQYNRLKEIDSAGSQDMLAGALTSIHIAEKPPEQMYDNTRAWNDIFRRYGMEDLINPLFKESATAQVINHDSKAGTSATGVKEEGLEFD